MTPGLPARVAGVRFPLVMTAPSLAALAVFTVKQFGHFSLAQARQVNLSRAAIHRLRQQGVVVRVQPRVYRLTSVAESTKGTLTAALLAAGSGAVASHSWAAWLLGLERVSRTRHPEITVPGGSRCRLRGVVMHRTSQLEPSDTVEKDGIPLTSGARTLIDLAGRLSMEQRMALADDAVRLRRTTRQWLYRRACALVNGRAGVTTLVWITRPGAEGEFWSWLERTFGRRVVRAHGLPEPDYNVSLYDDDGFVGVADACWRGDSMVISETDGIGFHASSAQRARDARQSNRHALSGRVVLRFPYEDVVGRPHVVATQIRKALERAGHPGVGSGSSQGPRPG